ADHGNLRARGRAICPGGVHVVLFLGLNLGGSWRADKGAARQEDVECAGNDSHGTPTRHAFLPSRNDFRGAIPGAWVGSHPERNSTLAAISVQISDPTPRVNSNLSARHRGPTRQSHAGAVSFSAPRELLIE